MTIDVVACIGIAAIIVATLLFKFRGRRSHPGIDNNSGGTSKGRING